MRQFVKLLGNHAQFCADPQFLRCVAVDQRTSSVITDTNRMNVTHSHAGVLTKLLDAAALRQRVIGKNIANVNTPGYHRSEVQFEKELAARLAGGSLNQREVANLNPTVVLTENLSERSDGNNVNIEMEVGELSKNEIMYQTIAQILATDMSILRTAIEGN